PLVRFHARSGADWKAVELAYASGFSVPELERRFGVDRATIYLRVRGGAWRTESSPEERAALEAEMGAGAALAPMPSGRAHGRAPRQARWGRNGCDWLKLELEYGLGDDTAAIARRAGVTVNHLRVRAAREGWLAEIPVETQIEMQRRILGAQAA